MCGFVQLTNLGLAFSHHVLLECSAKYPVRNCVRYVVFQCSPAQLCNQSVIKSGNATDKTASFGKINRAQLSSRLCLISTRRPLPALVTTRTILEHVSAHTELDTDAEKGLGQRHHPLCGVPFRQNTFSPSNGWVLSSLQVGPTVRCSSTQPVLAPDSMFKKQTIPVAFFVHVCFLISAASLTLISSGFDETETPPSERDAVNCGLFALRDLLADIQFNDAT